MRCCLRRRTGRRPVPQVPGWEQPTPIGSGRWSLRSPYALAAYEALRGVDIVHDHTVAGPLCARVPDGVPLVTTNHGPFVRIWDPSMRR
jgi:hypothetical protein